MAKKSFILRIEEKTFMSLEKWAGDEFRSVNGQIEWLIDKALKDAKRRKQKEEMVDTAIKKSLLKNSSPKHTST